MNSTIMVHKSVKDLAAKKAKAEGLSLSAVARFLLQGYADGKLNIGLVVGDQEIQRVDLDSQTQKILDDSVKKWRHKFAQ
jgi:hypothetical protein